MEQDGTKFGTKKTVKSATFKNSKKNGTFGTK
jgi:hypothetical protein